MTEKNLDYLAARLHGRRGRLAEADRLDGLCRLPDLSQLGRAFYPDTEFQAAGEFQLRLTQELVRELSNFVPYLERPGADLLVWMLVPFQLENIKVLLRSCLRRTPLASPKKSLVWLPNDLALDVQALTTADSLEEFANRLPKGVIRHHLSQALDRYQDHPKPFFLEAALDRCYFEELIRRTEGLSGEDKELIQPIVFQDADTFHFLLVVRGKFHYGLSSGSLLPYYIHHTRINLTRFQAMLATSDIPEVARLAVDRAIDVRASGPGSSETSVTVDPPTLEALAWKRFLRLSNRDFRRSHQGLAAVVGYLGVRRVEMVNLITVSEGIIAGTTRESLRARLLPRPDAEATYV